MTGPEAQAGDPYLWLEEVEGARALEWVRARNAETMASLGALPLFAQLKAEALAILGAKDRIPYPAVRAGQVYNFWQDDEHVRGIWRRTSLHSYETSEPAWETVLDIDALSAAEGKSWVYKGANFLAPDFQRCLIYLSDGGKDATTIREFDAGAKAFVDGGFSLSEAKQSADWLDRDTLLVARGLTEDELTQSGYPRVIRLLRRGGDLAENPVIYGAPTAYVSAAASALHHGGERIVLLSRAPSFFEAEYASLDEDGRAIPLPLPRFCVVRGFFAGHLIVAPRQDWAVDGKLHPAGSYLSFALAPVLKGAAMELQALFVPTAKRYAQGLAVAADAVYVNLLDNVAGRIEAYRWQGGAWRGAPIQVGDAGSVSVAFASPWDERVFVTYNDFLTPAKLMSWPELGAPPATIKSLPARFDAAGLEVSQLEARSKDGTPIPYFLVRARGAPGALPTLLYGYGGFEVALAPSYSAITGKLWLARGGQYVLANIRGGGEFGPKWHQAALKENRQRAFDDFHSVAEDLIRRGLAHPRGIGIMGGSNGGLLVGVAMIQRPDLYGAVVCAIPLLDMLRFNKLLAGASWMGEYGNPDLPNDRAVLAAYSPYQNLRADADYPVPLIWTSTRDDRVHPGHARKFAARMIEQGHRAYYFEEIEGGHSAGANLIQAAEHYALEFTYLAEQLM